MIEGRSCRANPDWELSGKRPPGPFSYVLPLYNLRFSPRYLGVLSPSLGAVRFFFTQTSCLFLINMRFNAAFTALVSSASLMGYAHAEEAEAAPDATSAIEKPTFTVFTRFPV